MLAEVKRTEELHLKHTEHEKHDIFCHAWESPRWLLKNTDFGVSHPECLIMGWGPVLCRSITFPDDVGESGRETIL